MMDRKAATRTSWKEILPLPPLKSRLSFNREFTQEEYAVIALGLIPIDMEDKWFIFLEADWLYFYRSWTGVCIYQLRLEKDEGKYSVTEAWANRDPNQYKGRTDAYDVALLSFLIDNFLLGKKTPFPLPGNVAEDWLKGLFKRLITYMSFKSNGPGKLSKGAYQHHISGSGYPEVTVSKKYEDS